MAGFLFLLVIIGLVTVGVQMSIQSSSRRRRKMFDTLASELYGEVVQEGRDLWLRVVHSGTELLAGCPGGFMAREQFICIANWPEADLELEVRPWALSAWLGMSSGRPVQLHSSLLRGQLAVTGNRPERIRQMLSPQVQAQLLVLRRANSYGRLQLNIAAGQLCIRKRRTVENAATLRMLVMSCLQLIDAALANVGEGVELIESQAAPEDIHCPVCGEQPFGRMVQCNRCGALHHQDCWQFNGNCARYGCSHERARVAEH